MAGYPILSLWITYGAVGALAYGADRRWGVATRGWFADLARPEPGEHTEGFLVARPWTVQLAWSGALAGAIAVLGVAVGRGVWYAEVPVALAGTAAALSGMRAVQLALAVRARLVAWRAARAETAALAAARAAELAAEPVDAREVVVAPSARELEAAKIARMHELLGRTA